MLMLPGASDQSYCIVWSPDEIIQPGRMNPTMDRIHCPPSEIHGFAKHIHCPADEMQAFAERIGCSRGKNSP